MSVENDRYFNARGWRQPASGPLWATILATLFVIPVALTAVASVVIFVWLIVSGLLG